MTQSIERERPPAVVLLSGGLDSTAVLAMARREGFAAYALSFHYGQRHDHAYTSSCYDPGPEGRPFGACDACLLRAKGFAEVGIPDPLCVRFAMG